VLTLAKSINPAKPSRNNPHTKGSHFFKCVGHCAAVSATCLCEFYIMLQTMDSETLKYYFQRDDFQKWLKGSVGAVELATKLSFLNEGFSGEKLRQELLTIVQGAAAEMKRRC